jgi:hypothetical protein
MIRWLEQHPTMILGIWIIGIGIYLWHSMNVVRAMDEAEQKKKNGDHR